MIVCLSVNEDKLEESCFIYIYVRMSDNHIV